MRFSGRPSKTAEDMCLSVASSNRACNKMYIANYKVIVFEIASITFSRYHNILSTNRSLLKAF